MNQQTPADSTAQWPHLAAGRSDDLGTGHDGR